MLDRVSVRIPDAILGQKLVERLKELSAKRDRTVNFLVVEAILEYLKREEKREG
ncbi:hypothetical protein KAX17_00510 [Candidatus Bipolaricaulota bacterium]|nr:hypothetical protein [Candidatus Bipolaricaulota bacterium]